MTTYNEWCAILTLAGLLSGNLYAKENFSFSLTPSKIQPGNRAVLKIRVPLNPEETESSVDISDSSLFELNSISVLEKASERTPCCLELRYELTGYQDLSTHLPPIEFKTPGNSFSTELLDLTVQSLRAQEDNELRESFPPLPLPWPYLKWLKKLSLISAIALLGFYLFRKWQSRPKRRKAVLKPLKSFTKEDPHLWLKQQLSQLKTKLKNDPSNELWIDEWGIIIRGFLFRKNCVPATSWTTREIKNTLAENSFVGGILAYLEASDQFKFSPTSVNETSIFNLVTHFIQETEKTLALCGNS
ncbi:MAG: hypothetical protein FJ112_07105 [Deltaproteobacteria bacterium]|nr:hypothetical protein [Deltaproteobacteria bacterium]